MNQYDCGWTGYANQYDRNLYYSVPEGMAITGVASVYNNRHEWVSFVKSEDNLD